MVAPRHNPTGTIPGERLLIMDPACGAAGMPCVLEIGPGRGDFLFHLARQAPATHVIGIEIKLARFRKLQARRGSLDNVTLIWGDARRALPTLAAEHAISEIFINFPDPWPKRRHAKNRLLHAAFLDQVIAALAPDGAMIFTTDAREYAEAVAGLCAMRPELRSTQAAPIVTENPDAYPTYFAQKWAAEGRRIYYQRYRRITRAE